MMNKAILVGRMTKDIEIRMTPSEKTVGTFSLAMQRYGKDSGADFISCVAFGATADLMKKYTHKGSRVGIAGRIQTRNYQKDEHTVYVTEIIVEDVEFLENKKEEADPITENGDELPY